MGGSSAYEAMQESMLEGLEAIVDKRDQEIQQLKAEREQLKAESDQLAKERAKALAELAELEVKEATLKAEVGRLTKERNEARADAANNETGWLATQQEMIMGLKKEVDLQAQVEQLTKERDELKTNIGEFAWRSDHHRLTAELDELRRTRVQTESKYDAPPTKTETDQHAIQVASLEGLNRVIAKERDEALAKLQEMKTKYEEHNTAFEKMLGALNRDDMVSLEIQINDRSFLVSHTKHLEQAKKERDEALARITKLETDLASVCSSHLNVVKSLEKTEVDRLHHDVRQVRKERDEALAKITKLETELDMTRHSRDCFQKQRDELRADPSEPAKRIRDAKWEAEHQSRLRWAAEVERDKLREQIKRETPEWLAELRSALYLIAKGQRAKIPFEGKTYEVVNKEAELKITEKDVNAWLHNWFPAHCVSGTVGDYYCRTRKAEEEWQTRYDELMKKKPVSVADERKLIQQLTEERDQVLQQMNEQVKVFDKLMARRRGIAAIDHENGRGYHTFYTTELNDTHDALKKLRDKKFLAHAGKAEGLRDWLFVTVVVLMLLLAMVADRAPGTRYAMGVLSLFVGCFNAHIYSRYNGLFATLFDDAMFAFLAGGTWLLGFVLLAMALCL
jgi:hypothetical protein